MLTVRVEKCAGCRICELVCAVYRFNTINPKKAAIRIIPLFPERGAYVPIVCRQCGVPPCVDACGEVCAEKCVPDAIYVAENGRVLIDEEKCIDCKVCLEACPLGAIFFHPDLKFPIKCDLCDGDPVCVKYCPTKALEFTPTSMAGQSKRLEVSKKLAGK